MVWLLVGLLPFGLFWILGDNYLKFCFFIRNNSFFCFKVIRSVSVWAQIVVVCKK